MSKLNPILAGSAQSIDAYQQAIAQTSQAVAQWLQQPEMYQGKSVDELRERITLDFNEQGLGNQAAIERAIEYFLKDSLSVHHPQCVAHLHCPSLVISQAAEVLINAIDDPQTNLQLAELAKEHFPHLQIISRARDVDHYIKLRQAGVEAPERETFEAALKSGRMTLEALGLGAYEARERADLFRRFNLQMVEEMVAMAENDAASRVAVFKRTSDMLTGIINEDRNHLSLVQRHGWQGTEEGRHTGDIADEPENKPPA